MNDIKFQILKTEEFNAWIGSQSNQVQSSVLARLYRIRVHGHFGLINTFDGLIELKWKIGLRIYTARLGQSVIVVLGGGNKNGQSKDIKQAKKILEKVKANLFRDS